MLKEDALKTMQSWLLGLLPFSALGEGGTETLADGPGWAIGFKELSLEEKREDLLGRVTCRWEVRFLLRLRLAFAEGDAESAENYQAAVLQLLGLSQQSPPDLGEKTRVLTPRQLQKAPPAGDGTRSLELILPVQFCETTEI